MKKTVWSLLLSLALCLSLLPTAAFAADAGALVQGKAANIEAANYIKASEKHKKPLTPKNNCTVDLYVSHTGTDLTGNGSQDAPYATLAKAAEIVNADQTGAAFTIHVLSDLSLTACARFYNHNVTIMGEGATAPVVTREEGFFTQSDPARGTYHPAMIEIQTSSDASTSLTLTNIIFDDAGKQEGGVFAQAVSGADDNAQYVQDAIIASNATESCTITLGDGAVLRNFGGESAIRATNKAVIVMQSGSVIEDTIQELIRGRGTAENEVGPAGAVWLQGGQFIMEQGAEIRNIDGRAVYIDSGKAEIGGTIRNITGNANMWQGKDGTAIHLRNTNASAILTTALIEDITGGGSAVYVTGPGNQVVSQYGSVIRNLTNTQGIYCTNSSDAQLGGEITGLVGSNALSINESSTAVLQSTGSIHDNACNTAVVYLRAGANFTVHGKINNNKSSGNCAALFLVTNGASSHAVLESGGEICGNKNGGSKYGTAVEVQQGESSFTMNGGIISGNSGPLGAIQVHKGSPKLIMNGGKVVDNLSSDVNGEAGIFVESGTPTVELNAGQAQSLTLAQNVLSQAAKGHIFISDGFVLEDVYINMRQDSKTIAPAADSLDLKLGNANKDSNTALKAAANAKGWGDPLASFWIQRSGAAELTIGGLALNDMPVYMLVQATDADGTPLTDAPVKVYMTERADTEGKIRFTIPDVSGSGCAVAIVQVSQDFGSKVITGPLEIHKGSKSTSVYDISYTGTYVLSASLLDILKLSSSGVPLTFVLELDSRLTAKTDTDGKFPYIFDGAGIFNIHEEHISISSDGHTITVVCSPVTDWGNAIKDMSSVSITLTGTGVLAAEDFKVGDFLNTTGHIKYKLNQNLSVYIPANIFLTKMVAQPIIPPIPHVPIPDVPVPNKPALNTDEHFAYIMGYPDGTVRPNSCVTRAEASTIFFRLLTDASRNQFWSTTNIYSDINATDWYNNAISTLSNAGIVSGYPDGTFRPNAPITRAEMAKMIALFAKLDQTENRFNDVAGHWAEEYITLAAGNGWLIGYSDGSFRPQQNITRAETITMINRVLERTPSVEAYLLAHDAMLTFPDCQPGQWFYIAVQEATNSHTCQRTAADGNEQWIALCANRDWTQLEH